MIEWLANAAQSQGPFALLAAYVILRLDRRMDRLQERMDRHLNGKAQGKGQA